MKSVPSERLETLVRAATRKPNPASSEPLYVCQATELVAATKLLPWWKPGQYVEDYRSGNVSLSDIVTRLAFLVVRGAGLDRHRPRLGVALDLQQVQAVRGGDPYPVRPGHLPVGGPTPTVNLGLKVGDVVRVKSGDEILATVDELLVNRGMAFHPEMMPLLRQDLSHLATSEQARRREDRPAQAIEEFLHRARRCRLRTARARDRSTVLGRARPTGERSGSSPW